MKPSTSLFPYFALDSSLLDGPDLLAPDTVLTDITADLRWVTTSRGKQRDLDEFGIGDCQVELNNQARKYDPTNTSSIYYGNIAPMRQVYVTAVLNGVDYPVWRGYIERWIVDYANPNLPLAGIDGADAFLLLSRAQMAEVAASFSGDLAGARFSRVLDLAEVSFPAGSRSIATGKTTFGASTLAEEGGNPLRYLQKATQSEGGAFYVSKTGVLTFEERNTTFGSSVATFSDDGAAGSIRYLTIDQSTDSDLLYNRVVCAGTTGTEQIAQDIASQVDNSTVSTLDRTGQLASSDNLMLEQAQWLAFQYGTPETRLRQVEVAVHSLSDARKADLLALELTDRVTVVRTPTGGGSPATISQQAIVVGIDHDISDGGKSWIVTVTFQAGSRIVPFILDDPVFGLLDSSPLAY